MITPISFPWVSLTAYELPVGLDHGHVQYSEAQEQSCNWILSTNISDSPLHSLSIILKTKQNKTKIKLKEKKP